MKAFALGLFICLCTGPFAMRSRADQTTLTFNFSDGGQETGLSGPPYATVTLKTDTTSTGCTNGCILVTGTASPGLNFFDQTSEGGIFGFNLASGIGASTISILNCSDSASSADNTTTCSKSSSNTYDSIGTYTVSASITGGSNTKSVSSATGVVGDAFAGFSFDIATTVAGGLSLDDINVPKTGDLTNIVSHVCENSGGGCMGSGTNSIIHAYIGVTPEPGSYLLFGSGLLALGIFLRRKQGQSLSGI